MDNGIKSKAWIGLRRDDENWGWVNGEKNNDFFYWRKGAADVENSEGTVAMMRLDLFGGGWDDVRDISKATALI